MTVGREAPQGGIPAQITRMADGLGRLVTEHITLARMELSEDARAMGTQLARIAVFAPFIVVGYAFLCGALAYALSSVMPMGVAMLIVGAVNVLGGGFGIYRAAMALRSHKPMNDTMNEVSQTLKNTVTSPTEHV